ncbi:MAG: CehA/McbA family metallohydrolase [Candidatus Sumerlaeota bacterium]|nr:CehA/McbA family metallohydrolase [Candidatus Sumerlaeota bacterium]
MKPVIKKLAFFLCLLLIPSPSPHAAEWFKGNTHTHTNLSDGDSSPAVAVKWYKDHGYQFVVITDHNKAGDGGGMQAKFGEAGRFLVISGEEVTCAVEKKPVHLNAINCAERIAPINDATIASALQKNVDAIRSAGAIPTINHPNFRWAFGSAEMENVKSVGLFEFQNKHPTVNNAGRAGNPGTEEIWDTLLSKGMKIYGVASDDAHHYKDFLASRANPGRGWVYAHCDSLTPEAVAVALDKGDFYASTGVELTEIASDGKSLSIAVKSSGDAGYTIEFIGKSGAALAQESGAKSVYRFSGKEGYVRARVTDSNGQRAWTQPIFLGGK